MRPATPDVTITAAALATLVAGELVGDPAATVASVATLAEAGPDALSWLGDPKYLPRLATSQAAIVLVPQQCEVPPGRTVIRVADPDLALCTALQALMPPMDDIPPGVDFSARVAPDATVTGTRIGPNVYVGPQAMVGPGTRLYPGVYVGLGCRIGRDCTLYANAVVREHSVLGDRVTIHANATIGADGFGYLQRGGEHRKIPQIGHVVIEDDVEIGANTCIDRARSGVTLIGRGSKIDNLVQIGHNVRLGKHCILISQCGVSGSTTLGDYVVLAGQVGLIDHLRIGQRVVVAAKSGVSSDIPDGQVYRGIPAVPNNEYSRSAVVVRKLPKVVEQLRDLQKRIEQLESAAHDTKGS